MVLEPGNIHITRNVELAERIILLGNERRHRSIVQPTVDIRVAVQEGKVKVGGPMVIHAGEVPVEFALRGVDKSIPARIAIMAKTTSNSMTVKAPGLPRIVCMVLSGIGIAVVRLDLRLMEKMPRGEPIAGTRGLPNGQTFC